VFCRLTALLLVFCLLLGGGFVEYVGAASPNDLPDLVVAEINRTSSGKLQLTFANIGLADLIKGWAVAADVFFDQTKMGTMMLNNAPTSSTGGGVGYAGGTSTFILAWDIVKPVTVMVSVDVFNAVVEANEKNNTLIVSPEPPPPPPPELPDLVVADITRTMGGKLQVTFANIGLADLAKGWAAAADVYFDQSKMGTMMINNVPTSSTGGGVGFAGGTSTFILAWDIEEPVAVMVSVDVFNAVAEANEKNNTLTVSLDPPPLPPALPDLIVQSVSLGAGNMLEITFANIGKGDLAKGWTAWVKVFIGQTNSSAFLLESNSVSTTGGGVDVAGGTSTFLVASWPITAPVVVSVFVDATDTVDEADENNNTKIVELSPQPDPPGTPLPDLVVDGIMAGPGDRLAVVVRNAGAGAVPKGSTAIAKVYVNGQAAGYFDLGRPVESFLGGIAVPGGFSSYLLVDQITETTTVRVEADATGLIVEANEQNNSREEICQPGYVPKDLPTEPPVGLGFNIGSKSYWVGGMLRYMDVAPVIVENRTLMPIRFVAEAIGAEVGWDEETRKVTLTLGLRMIELWIGNPLARINGKVMPIDPSNTAVFPFISENRTYIPLRFVAESLLGDVSWDEVTRGVGIHFAAIAIDDDITWSKVDEFGQLVVDDQVVWARFTQGVQEIDDDITWMKGDNRRLELTGLIDPDPPYHPTELIDPEPPH